MSITELVARAGRAFIAAKTKDPAVEGAALAEWLRSGAPITQEDRELLAQLVTGEWRRPDKKPKKGIGSGEVARILEHYHQLEAEYGPRLKKNAKTDTAGKFQISVSSLETYLTRERERANAVSKAKRTK